MRIEQKDYSKIDYPQLYRKEIKGKRPLTRLARFFLSLAFTLLLIILISGISIKLVIGPIMQRADALPGDFPAELSFYQLDQAEISVQNQQSRQKIIKLIEKMPNWLIQPVAEKISPMIEKQLQQTFGDQLDEVAPNAPDIKKFLSDNKLNKLKSISLSWINLEKSKEELTGYYKEKLDAAGFKLEENIDDYEISLGFWKDDIFGNIKLQDDQNSLYKSDVNMTVNYFSQ